MEGLQLNLLGKPEVLLDGSPVTAFESVKSPALLFYLAVTGQAHSREILATLLWGNLPETTARRNLTKALTNLRYLLEPYLLIERYSVAFNYQMPSAVDVTLFQAAVEGSALLEPSDPVRDLAPLRQAVSLYRGDFLEGFYVKNALEFEEWVLEQREYLRELMLRGLRHLTEQSARLETDPVVALAYCQRWLELEPFQEIAHRQMMLLLVHNGQRDAALAQYELCCRVLADEFDAEPMAEMTALYERIKTAGTPPLHNLPPAPNVFVGRKDELEQIATQLAESTCRLLTVVGPGGIGKTRLALEAARRYLQPETMMEEISFAEGIFFVDLAPLDIDTPPTNLTDQLAAAIASVLNYPLQGTTEISTQLFDYLSDKEMLLVLDNFEPLAAWADILAELLRQAPRVKLLVTSRERLNLQEEWILAVGGLSYPGRRTAGHKDGRADTNAQWQIPDYQSYDAVALFIHRAQQIQTGLSLPEAEGADIVRICQRVDGMPLGLELAASWLRVLSCQEIAAEIERSFDFLTTSLRNLPERHRSMQAVFESSWKLLAANEQAAMRKLSVFRGGFLREAGAEVAGASLPILAALVDKSFLRRAATGRYEIHALIRQYAAEKLTQNPTEAKEVRRTHCRYYAHFLQQRSERLNSDQQASTLQELTAENDNIRAGWQHALVPDQPLAAAEINHYIYSLRTLYERRGWYQEGLAMFSHAAQHLAERYSDHPAPEHHIAYGRVLLQVGFFHHLLGHYQPATDFYQQSLQLLQASTVAQPDLIRDQAYAMRMLGNIYWRRGDYSTAKALTLEGIALIKTIADAYQEAHLTLNLGMITFDMGNYERAEDILRQSRSVYEAVGDRWDLADIIGYLGQIAYLLGRETEADQLLEESLSMSRKVGDPWVIMRALQHRGSVLNLMAQSASTPALQRQIYTDAGRVIRKSLAISRKIGSAFYQAFSLNQLGYATIGLGEYPSAQEHFVESLTIANTLQTAPLMLDTLVGLSIILIQADTPDSDYHQRAIQFLNLALRHASATQQTRNRAAAFQVEMGLPTEMLATTPEDNQAKSLEQVVADILDKLHLPD